MFKLNQVNRNAIMSIVILLVIISALTAARTSSQYQPMPIVIKSVNEGSIFDLENKVECTPGREQGSPYTKSLTPGGLCGAQKLVSDYAGYSIDGGIGGSLI
jgi:hypothetical protein